MALTVGAVAAGFGAVLFALTSTTVASADPSSPGGPLPEGQAWFEGEVIDLGGGWGEAQACLIWRQEEVAECFRSQAEMDARASEVERRPATADATTVSMAVTSCSGWLYLYDGPASTGAVAQFRDRGYWQNLATWGFSDRTESYRIGPCSASFADGTSGSGLYPGPTTAYVYSASMYAGWDNRVSSIIIW